MALCVLGKKIKKKLVDMDRNQAWLIDQVKQETGLYFDSSYLYKIMAGRIATPKIVEAICTVLEIENTTEADALLTGSQPEPAEG